MAKMTMVQALNLALKQEMAKDDRVILLGEDVGIDGGVFRVTDGLIDQFGELHLKLLGHTAHGQPFGAQHVGCSVHLLIVIVQVS